jgi:hypothetical protein
MRDKDYYDGEAIWKLPAFGIAAFNVPDAARFVAKILCLEGLLDKHVPDEEDQYCLNNPILDSLLEKEIQEYETAILSGIEKSTLKTLHTSRDIHDQVDGGETYVDIDALHDWFSERGIEISGDFYAQYLDQVCEIHSAAIESIVIYEDKIRRKIRDDFGSPDKEKIYMLERKLRDFESQLPKEPVQEKTLGTREHQTLQKMIIGMAKDAYGYDPRASRSPFHKELEGVLDGLGISVSDDTIRDKLKEAAELLPQNIENFDN